MKRFLIMRILVTIGLIGLFLPDLLAFDKEMDDVRWWYRPEIKDTLQITPDLMHRLDEIWMEHTKLLINIRNDMKKAYFDLENLLSQEVIETQAAEKLIEKLGQLHAKNTEERIKMAIEIRKELTFEQFKKLKEIENQKKRSAPHPPPPSDGMRGSGPEPNQ